MEGGTGKEGGVVVAPRLRTIVGETFRAGTGYSLVPADRLPANVRPVVAPLLDSPTIYGVLLPRAPGLAPRAVDPDTALLLHTLKEPGPVPRYMRAALGDNCNRVLTELVLDSVLELATGDAFVSGPSAHPLLFDLSDAVTSLGRIARLSLDALEYAQRLELDDHGRLSARLYLYNHLPLTPRLRRRFQGPDEVSVFLGLVPDKVALVRRPWRAAAPAEQVGWHSWHRDDLPPPPEAERMWKLYVSPGLEELPDVLRIVAGELSELEAVSVKVGSDVHGLLRPDKLVAYFWSFEALHEAIVRLEPAVAGAEAHGVPFTAEAAGDGVLSWGIDLLPAAGTPLPAESWRLWVTNRLAAALVAARCADVDRAGPEPWVFALDRLRVEGVDPATWTPSQSLFVAR